jgi:hypothetical protein
MGSAQIIPIESRKREEGEGERVKWDWGGPTNSRPIPRDAPCTMDMPPPPPPPWRRTPSSRPPPSSPSLLLSSPSRIDCLHGFAMRGERGGWINEVMVCWFPWLNSGTRSLSFFFFCGRERGCISLFEFIEFL